MRECAGIVAEYRLAVQNGEEVALATVVHLEGSGYRSPGARMLVRGNGQLTGAVSGGCLEGDARRKALNVIRQRRNRLIVYDTADDEGDLGVQLGCEGRIFILLEYIDPDAADNAIELLASSLGNSREPKVLVTLFSLGIGADQIGTVALLSQGDFLVAGRASDLPEELRNDAGQALEQRRSAIGQYATGMNTVTALIEYREPPVLLVIAGGGNDAMPLVHFARMLGWETILVDGRPTHANAARFPHAGRILVGKPEYVVPQIGFDNRTAVVLMTHNYPYDKAMLKLTLEEPSPYIGMLGPQKKLHRILDELEVEGTILNSEDRSRIYGPTGLDIAAETPEEIAISIIAEIKSVMSGASAEPLRNKDGAIHERPEVDSPGVLAEASVPRVLRT